MLHLRQIICLFFLTTFSFTFLHAQNIPQGINYQAVVRDANGNAKTNEQVPVQFTIYQSSATGTMIYKEQQLLTTNNYGQFNAIIGQGNPVTPFTSTSFENIDWALDSTFIKVELNANTSFTGVFTQIGTTTKFQSVPYALSAKTKAPTMQVFLSGSGTYTTPAGVKYIKIRMVGGGGGGSIFGSGAGSNGNNSTFGTSLLTASGGTGANGQNGATGGAYIINSPAVGFGTIGGSGGAGAINASQDAGGVGGSSFFGGGGAGTTGSGGNGVANTGGGGGGGKQGGGGAGGYLEAFIYDPNPTYLYTVAAASGGLGSSGGSGIIIIEEYYQ